MRGRWFVRILVALVLVSSFFPGWKNIYNRLNYGNELDWQGKRYSSLSTGRYSRTNPQTSGEMSRSKAIRLFGFPFLVAAQYQTL